jgi:iron complex outermembrane receptor protein
MGFDHRTYIIVPDGNYFINPEESGSNILYGRTGGIHSGIKNLFSEKLRFRRYPSWRIKMNTIR